MTENRNEADSDARREDKQGRSAQADPQSQDVESATQWFAGTAVRIGLTVIGVVILLFALGQAVGLPLLELATEAITSQTGQWLLVAFFAVLLIGAAQKGLGTR